MPFVRNTYLNHPTTSVAGLWIETTSGLGLVGLARTAWPAVQSTGTAEQKRLAFETALTNAMQPLLESTTTLASNDPRLTTPEFGCRRGTGNNYISRHTVILVTVKSVVPSIVLGHVKLVENAARTVRV